ncbi:MAG TPA: right-handed parallel beta-helix repeat-containing protein [Acetobacteraceae bacterium]|nr:right-handed parallel beta-helix repeat-containing protein [Acetobacteraceae bacterium]
MRVVAGPATGTVLRVLAAGAVALLAGCAPATLAVGPTGELKRPSQAIAAASSGDTILIAPGTYADCAVVKASNVTIAGSGPGVVLTGKVCGGKAILVTRGDDITIRNLTLQHARDRDHNGAGIRSEGVNLTVDGVRFVDDEDGILAGNKRDSSIRVLNSDFEGNGTCAGAGGCAHGLYVAHIKRLDVENSRFYGQLEGHHIKSRALTTVVSGNQIADGPDGTASYEIDVPNGGSVDIERNKIEKGPKAQNWSAAIVIGEGGRIQPSKGIVIRNNTFANDNDHETIFVHNLTPDPARLSGNTFSGKVTPLRGPGEVIATRGGAGF